MESRQVHEKFSDIVLSTMKEGVDIVDEKLRILYMNKQFLDMFSKKSLGKKCYEVYKDNKKQCEKCPLKRSIKIGETKTLVAEGIAGRRTFEITHTGTRLSSGRKGVLEVFRDITEHKKAEEKLKIFMKGFDNLPNSMVVVEYKNNEPCIMYVNEGFTKYYGYKESEAIGKNPNLLKSGKQGKEFYKKLWGALLNPKKGYWRGELINKRKDGSLIPVILIITTIFDKRKKPRYFVANHMDITEHRKLLHDLGERYKELNCLYAFAKIIEKHKMELEETCRALIKILPPAYQYPEATCARIIINSKEFKTKNFKQTKWKQAAEFKAFGKRACAIEVFYTEKRPHEYEGPFLKEERNLINALAERLGRVIEYIKAQELLKEAKYFKRTVLDTSSDCIKILDKKGKLVYLSKGGLKEHGFKTEKETKNWDWLSAIVKEQRKEIIKALNRSAKGEVVDLDVEHVKGTSNKEWCNMSFSPIKDEKSKIISVLVMSRDITERKKAERKLKTAYEQLQEAARLKDELFNITSHELKTPLIPLIAYTDQMRRGVFGGLNEDQQQAFETMDKNILNLSNLIDEFLDISKLQAGKMQFTISKAQPEKLIQEAVKPLRQKANEKGLEIKLAIKKGLPEIYVDTLRIQQALAKIMLNAVQFTKKGSITIKAEKEKNNLIIDIIDTGIGIPKQYHSRIFEKFFQAEPSYTREHGGIGLGLKISRRIIQAHGGTLELLKSEVGKGSTFRITLPIKEKQEINKMAKARV